MNRLDLATRSVLTLGILTFSATASAEIFPAGAVTPEVMVDGGSVTFTRGGATPNGFAWSEATLWNPDGSYLVLGSTDHENFSQIVTPTTGPGRYAIQYRLVDTLADYQDQYLWFEVTPASLPPSADSVTNSGTPTYETSFAVYANNVKNATQVLFPTWTEAGGQDDLVWYQGSFDAANNRWTRTVNIGDHGNQRGAYISHAYAIGADGKAHILGGTVVTVALRPVVGTGDGPLSVEFVRTPTAPLGTAQVATFVVSANASASDQIGLQRCDASGNPLATVDSSPGSLAFLHWTASAAGTYYFKGYVKKAYGSQTAFTELKSLTVTATAPRTYTLWADQWFNYNGTSQVRMAGGGPITVDDVTGYVISGRLGDSDDQYLDYAPGKRITALHHSLVKFSGGYVADTYLHESGTWVSLEYGPARSAEFLPQSHIKFSGGYVSDGYLNSPFGSAHLAYGVDLATDFAPQSHAKFSDGYVSDGYLNGLSSSVELSYGPGRTTNFAPQSHIRFNGGYVSDGYMNNFGSWVDLNYGSDSTARFLPACHVTFAHGYVVTGTLANDGLNTFRYNAAGDTVRININPSSMYDNVPNKDTVNAILKDIHKSWAALINLALVNTKIILKANGVMEFSGDDGQELVDALTAVETTQAQLPIIYASVPDLANKYTIHIQYPSVAFTAGSDGRGYLAIGQLAYDSWLTGKTGNVYVGAGKTVTFLDGYYTP